MISYRFLTPAEEEMTEAHCFMKPRPVDSKLISLMTYNEQSPWPPTSVLELARDPLTLFPKNIHYNKSRSSGWPPCSAQSEGVVPTFVSFTLRSAPWSRRNSTIARCPLCAA